MGKSTIASLVEKRGVEVVDTDQLARVVVQPGEPALKEIEGLFGSGVITPEGALNRPEFFISSCHRPKANGMATP